MKKTYMQPATIIVGIKVKSYMQALSKTKETQAGQGSESSPVNFGKRRRGIFQDDYEEEQSIW